MTIWSPRLPDSAEPIYARIADALERDVRAGVLISGSQLPTHRDLARSLGITAVTVTRAYGEAARRGLVESATGRGTFVRTARTSAAVRPANEIDLATNVVNIPLPLPSPAMLDRAAKTLASATYAAGAGSERHRAAGAAWLEQSGVHGTDPSRIVVTAGTQHAILLAFAATARAGDTILTEAVTYHGAKSIAAMLGIRLQPLPLDRYGLVPDALERAVRGRGPKVLYTIPSLHNPTGIVFPDKRRRELAAIASKHGVTIIEDDVCGFLLAATPPPLITFAPERTIFLTGLGKALAPSLRVGYLAAPDAWLPRLNAALAASVLFASPVTAELAASWIEDGTAAKIVELKRAEVALRNRTARRILPKATGDARSGHLWMEVPKRWTPDAFADEARRRRVRVASATSFAVGETPRAVRVCIGSPANVAELETALHILGGITEERIDEPVV